MTLADLVAQYGEAEVTRWAETGRRIETELPRLAQQSGDLRMASWGPGADLYYDGGNWSVDYSGSDTKASDFGDLLDALDVAWERMAEQREREGLLRCGLTRGWWWTTW